MHAEASIQKIEDFLRQGHFNLARAEIKRIPRAVIAREELARLGNLARRLGLFTLGLQLLLPVVRPDKLSSAPASEAEIAIYAALLIKVGASAEAIQLLQGLTSEPNRFLYSAFARQSQWDYPGAVELLMTYLASSGLTAYERVIAKVNLAAAYLFCEELDGCRALLVEIKKETSENDWKLLYANSQEIEAGLAIRLEQWSVAEELLGNARRHLTDRSNAQLYLKKWEAVMPLLRWGPSADRLQNLAELRLEAAKQNHWETVRDCDSVRAAAVNDSDLLTYLYFGTPYAHYRQNLESKIKNEFIIPAAYVRTRDAGSAPPEDVLDLEIGRGGFWSVALVKPGQQNHQLLVALNRDFYRPALLGVVAAELFPGEYFDPFHTPHRVFASVSRLRGWIKSKCLPVTVSASNGGFLLTLNDSSFGFKLAREVAERPHGAMSVQVTRLLNRFCSHTFTALEAAGHLEISLRAAQALLKEGQQLGLLQRTGSARASRYQIFQDVRKAG